MRVCRSAFVGTLFPAGHHDEGFTWKSHGTGVLIQGDTINVWGLRLGVTRVQVKLLVSLVLENATY